MTLLLHHPRPFFLLRFIPTSALHLLQQQQLYLSHRTNVRPIQSLQHSQLSLPQMLPRLPPQSILLSPISVPITPHAIPENVRTASVLNAFKTNRDLSGLSSCGPSFNLLFYLSHTCFLFYFHRNKTHSTQKK
jgi:hypothetical protein